MEIQKDLKLDYADVMLVPTVSDIYSRAEVELYNSDGVVPIIAANMDGVGTFEMAKQLAKMGLITALHKHYEILPLVAFYENNSHITEHYVIYSMGANMQDLLKFREVWSKLRPSLRQPKTVCIDVANGYTRPTADFITSFRKEFPDVKIIAGNVVTEEGVFLLANAGAHVIKIGIGPGSVCTTRRMTGIGYPQFSAVVECVQAAKTFGHQGTRNRHSYKSPKIIADGGITCPGDIAKALAAGADYVMLGGMFAGHDESGGEDILRHLGSSQYEVTHKKFYGMASKAAQQLHNGGLKDYRASEGKEVLVPYRGPVRNTVLDMLGGLSSACSYLGVRKIDDISNEPQFIRVNNQLNNIFGS